jgi:hypothetical protein
MCNKLDTIIKWGGSLPNSYNSYSQRAMPHRLLTLPNDVRLKVLEYVAADYVIPALAYSEFCRLFLSSTSLHQSHTPEDLSPCTCQRPTETIGQQPLSRPSQILRHSLLHVNRQLRQEYIGILKREINVLICHCTLFSKIEVLERSLTPSFTQEYISKLKQLSISVKQTKNLINFFSDCSGAQTWPHWDSEHRIALTSLGVHLTMFLNINGIDAFANLEHLSILWEIHSKKTFLLLDDSDMETALEIIQWKTRSKLARLRTVNLQVEHGSHWKRQKWMKTREGWEFCEKAISD